MGPLAAGARARVAVALDGTNADLILEALTGHA